MELEYKDDRRKGKFVILVGVVLAVVAGGIAFYTINQARQQAGTGSTQKVAAVVAVTAIQARAEVKPEDVAVREVPLDETNANGVVADPKDVVGHIAAVTILQGQLVTTNMLASATNGAPFAILEPEETVGPDSPAWRAISLTVPDDLAVGGMLQPGQTVDVFVSAVVNVTPVAGGRFIPDRSTKITYQDMVILARKDTFYIVRAPLAIAEEIAHLQATGSATFSFALRPVEDQRQVDATSLGETTNKIIEKYGLPIPEQILPGFTPAPTPSFELPSGSPDPNASPVPGDPAASTAPYVAPSASAAP